MAKRAVIPVDMEMIHALLLLPDGMEVLHAAPSDDGLRINLVVTAPDMRDIDPAAYPPVVTPMYERTADGAVRLHSIDYPRENGDQR